MSESESSYEGASGSAKRMAPIWVYAAIGHSLNIASAWMMTCFVGVSRRSGFTPRFRKSVFTAALTPAFTSSRCGFVQSAFRFSFNSLHDVADEVAEKLLVVERGDVHGHGVVERQLLRCPG